MVSSQSIPASSSSVVEQQHHASPVDEVVAALGTDTSGGLSPEVAEERLRRDGPNNIRSEARISQWTRLLAQFRSPLVALLGVAMVVSFVAWSLEGTEKVPIDAIVIAIIVVLNGALGFAQERRADDAVQELRRLASPHAIVVRGGTQIELPVSEVVVGDLVVLREGDIVPADGRIIESHTLGVAEASLTGESQPSTKSPAAVDASAALADRTSMVYATTPVVHGTAKVIVTATGMKTEVGAIADLLVMTEMPATPLEREMAVVGRTLGVAVIAVSIIVVGTTWWFSSVDTTSEAVELLLIGVSLAVAAVPEGLPAVLSLVLAIGTRRMAKRNAIVKRLAFAETLGSTTVICTDKTGTLTRNEMNVRRVVTRDHEFAREDGVGYAPTGALIALDESNEFGDAIELLRAAVLASDADIRETEDSWESVGDPTEAALVSAAYGAGLRVNDVRAESERFDELPFDSGIKRMSVLVGTAEPGGETRVVEKGAPEVMIPRCTHEWSAGGRSPMDEAGRGWWRDAVERLGDEGLRTLAIAAAPNGNGHALTDVESDELALLGVVGILDPPRTEVRDAVADAQRAGIRVIMITGDHPRTASQIAKEVGIGSESTIVTTGDELENIAAGDSAMQSDVFARVAPRHKIDLVQALQQRGHVVAMTGDGVNDAPALKAADIGIAMGISGSDVSKGAADMILVDDNFATIVAAVEEGRAIFENVAAFLRYLLSSNTGEVLTMLIGVVAASLFGLEGPGGAVAPLLATQILWINLLTDTGPALALGVEPADHAVMLRKPRSSDSRLVDAAMIKSIVLLGLTMAIVTLLMVDAKLPGGLVEGTGDLVEARTVGFTVLVFAQLFNAFNTRSETRSAFHGLMANRWLVGMVAVSAVLQVMVVHVGFLNEAFNTTPLALSDWFWCAMAGSAVLWVGELQILFRKRSAR